MAQRHIEDLEVALTRNHWQVLERSFGESYEEPAVWVIGRPDKTAMRHIVFSPNPDLDGQTIDDSLGCDIAGLEGSNVYFARGASWKKELTRLVDALNDSVNGIKR